MLNVTRRSTPIALALTLLILSLVAVSCGTRTEETSTPPPASEPAPTATLSDANIAAIVVAANTIDIKNGELARTKTRNDAVKKFADQMVTDHTSVNKQAVDLVTRLGVTPEENETSLGLVASTDATRAQLSARTGTDFDKAYVDNEVAYHQAVLDMLDNTLIPGAANAELKTLLQNTRPAFVAHLDHAKMIQADLSK